MVKAPVLRRVLILCDSASLAGRIEAELGELAVTSVHDPAELLPPVAEQGITDPDIVVVVIHSVVEAPLVRLAQARLLKLIGSVPLLVVSQRPFRSIPELSISYVPLPQTEGELCQGFRRLRLAYPLHTPEL